MCWMYGVLNIVMASLEVDRSPDKGVVIIAGGCVRKSKSIAALRTRHRGAKVCIDTRRRESSLVQVRIRLVR